MTEAQEPEQEQESEEHIVEIVWGTAETRAENPKGIAYRFASAQEMTAFLDGVEAASGWLDYVIMSIDPDPALRSEAEADEQEFQQVRLGFTVQRAYIHEGTVDVTINVPKPMVHRLLTHNVPLPDKYMDHARNLAATHIDDIELELTDQLREEEDNVVWNGKFEAGGDLD